MPVVRDFRRYTFLSGRVDRCGRFIGRKSYWKLYAIENVVRTFMHSVLSVQIGPNWLSLSISRNKAAQLQRFRQQYVAKPQHAYPGIHDIYLLFLSDLTRIMTLHSGQLVQVTPNIAQWILRLENIALPRNLIGHMNFPNSFDQQQIDTAYHALPELLQRLEDNHIPIQVP